MHKMMILTILFCSCQTIKQTRLVLMLDGKEGYVCHDNSDGSGYIDEITKDIWKGGWKVDSMKNEWCWQYRVIIK